MHAVGGLSPRARTSFVRSPAAIGPTEENGVITAIRYIDAAQALPLAGPPAVHALRVFYDLPLLQVRSRLDEAIGAGAFGVAPADLVALESGSVREELLGRLFSSEVLERAFVGTEEVPSRRAG